MKNITLVIITFLAIFNVQNVEAKLIDKIAGVINDRVYSLSELTRIKKTILARKTIAPFIYNKKSRYSLNDILKVQQRKFIIKDKLSAQGFVVSDDSVEARIKDTETRQGITRKMLIGFLKDQGITYLEYFELIREATEFNIFNSRIIAPLVNITEQELKNLYYNRNSSNKAVSFQYNLVDFTLPKSKIQKRDYKKFISILETYKQTGNIPSLYRSLESSEMGDLSDDDLPKNLSRVLRQTNEKSFSKAYIKDGIVHFFYLNKKELTASQDYLSQKRSLQSELYSKRSVSIINNWFSRESFSYYILENI
jgi:peptidyl-prolyl cis-trans isomerase SurA